MLANVSLFVGVMGLISVIVGGLRLTSGAEKAAASLASKANQEVTEEHRKKAKQNGIAMVLLGFFLVGICVYNFLMLTGYLM